MKDGLGGRGPLLVLFAVLLGVALHEPAEANSFPDNSIVWDGWATDPHWNTTDVLGLPDITGWGFTRSGSTLEAIHIDYNRGLGPYNTSTASWISYAWEQLLRAGDLFIDIVTKSQTDAAWDYVFISGGSESYGPGLAAGLYRFNSPSGLAVNPTAISGSPGDSNYPYLITKDDRNQFDDDAKYTWEYRNHHPWALKDGSLVTLVSNAASFSWDILGSPGVTVGHALFTGLGIGLDPTTAEGIRIGFTFNCANDVLYDSQPVPEPTTLLLLGSGLVGVLCQKRRRIGRHIRA